MSKLTIRAGLEQGRAAYAYQCAQKGASLDKKKEYKSYVKKMPMLIKTNGLGAAVAFAFAKGAKNGVAQENDPWGVLYDQLEQWIREKGTLGQFPENRLAEKLTGISSADYRAATVEILALLNWIKRFADALIEGTAED
jgi:CRISPR-associated protein Cmr5